MATHATGDDRKALRFQDLSYSQKPISLYFINFDVFHAAERTRKKSTEKTYCIAFSVAADLAWILRTGYHIRRREANQEYDNDEK